MSTVTPSQIAKVITVIAEFNGLQALLESGCLTALLRDFVPNTIIVKARVDYNLSLAQMIEAGEYDRTADDITWGNFTVKKRESGEVELHIVGFGRDMTTDEVLAELDKRNLRPAELSELLALGATHRNLQRSFPFIALGSRLLTPDDDVGYPFLSEEDDKRHLGVSIYDEVLGPERRWRGEARFLPEAPKVGVNDEWVEHEDANLPAGYKLYTHYNDDGPLSWHYLNYRGNVCTGDTCEIGVDEWYGPFY